MDVTEDLIRPYGLNIDIKHMVGFTIAWTNSLSSIYLVEVVITSLINFVLKIVQYIHYV